MKKEVLRLEDIYYKEHGRTHLQDFSMTLYKGDIMGVFSQHASVKNALTGLLTGKNVAQTGRMYIEDVACHFEEKILIQHHKIAVVDAVNTLIHTLSVADNIFVIRRGFKPYKIDRTVLNNQTALLMKTIELSIAPQTLVSKLSSVERTLLELVKAFALGASIVVLKDISSYLSDADMEEVYRVVRTLKNMGITFLIIDSSVQVMEKYTEQVMVIRGGRSAWIFKDKEFKGPLLQRYFFTETDVQEFITDLEPAIPFSKKEVVLTFEELETDILLPLNLKLHRGEALNLFDPDGHGIESIKAVLSGEVKPKRGRVLINGMDKRGKNSWETLKEGIAIMPEYPTETLIFKDLTALENLCYAASLKKATFWLDPAYLRSCQLEYSPYFEPERLSLYPDQLTQQELLKVVYLRWHLYKPAVVVCVKPFNSPDKSLIDCGIACTNMLLQKGISVLMLTANFSETGLHCEKKLINTKESPLASKE